jgi:hypothetical protein
LNDIKFFKIIQNILSSNQHIHYAGNIVDVSTPYLSEYHKIHPELPKNLLIQKTKYCSGRFYILSQFAIQFLLKQKEKIEKEYLEDYAIGFYLHPILKEKMCNIKTNKYFCDTL